MRTLYHLWLSPFSRKVRLALGEKKLPFELHFERTWERRPEFMAMNPAGKVPVFQDEDGEVIADSYAICEYLEERYPDPPLIPGDVLERAEVRRLAGWFDTKFEREVTATLVNEKVFKQFMQMGEPDSEAIRAAADNVHGHLDYIAYLAETRNWLAGETITLADLAAGAQLSCVDYLGHVPWDKHPGAKTWYARLKSRPSFRPLLKDFIAGLPPPRHYADLDF